MILTRESVELLAPAGNWATLEAAIEAGADAVYLGGKQFNMRMHRNSETNFDNEMLKRAVKYTHERGVALYITLNNILSDEEIEPLKKYLLYLNEIRPDAIIVQDLALLKLRGELGITVPFHSSVMMNTNNEHAIEILKQHGVTRIVASRELSLAELEILKERSGVEIEYFIHGDMCIAESGQCLHSGVVFGQSSNRGRCLKPCRWPYAIVNEETGEKLGDSLYRLALNDMCMYRHIPELIQAGVKSFKIEGRMRSAEYISRIVSTYRKAIDAYILEPIAYTTDEESWQDLVKNRARNFTTTFAVGRPGQHDIGWDGSREPKIFSVAKKEANFQDEHIKGERPINLEQNERTLLSVQVSDMDSLKMAIDNGADSVYLASEAYYPKKPWRIRDIEEAIRYCHNKERLVYAMTPRSAKHRECSEVEQFFSSLMNLSDRPDGVLVGNLGTLRLAQEHAEIPILADFSFNIFNSMATNFLKSMGVSMATASIEMSFSQHRSLAENSCLPTEIIVHGACESMLCDHDFISLANSNGESIPCDPANKALLDEAGESHPLRVDQFGRTHILFSNDICLYPYLDKFIGIKSLRIEAKDYTPEITGKVTKIYRSALDKLEKGDPFMDDSDFATLKEICPRPLGIGAYRFRQSMDALK